MVLLNVVLFAVSGFLGLGFLLQTLHRLSQVRAIGEATPGAVETMAEIPPPDAEAGGALPPPMPGHRQVPGAPVPGALDAVRGQWADASVKTVFRIWVLVFALVGAQMGWVLRPFVGHPRADFTFFRERKQNFFQAVGEKVQELFETERPGSGN
jgi:hypothetical protein